LVKLRTTPRLDTDFTAWLDSTQCKWGSTQRDIVRRAYRIADAACREGNQDQQLNACLLRNLSVAGILVDLRMDHRTVAAALLHEALASELWPLAKLAEVFDPQVINLVDGATKLDAIGELHRQDHHNQKQLESLRKMLLAMAQDVRVVLIILAIRLAKMRGLEDLSDSERRRFAQETLNVFTPLANRLGIGQVKWELEDLALRYLEPVTYKKLARALDERRADRERYIARVIETLQGQLERTGIKARVYGRVKHIYSIWRKMTRKHLPFERIFDVRAVRIMVETLADCYAVLGVVHSLWGHIPREFDDYIANPKGNGYQSLHTAVVGPEGKIIEVQIRTLEMHQNAELGVAAHWQYKEGGGSHGRAYDQQIAWLRSLLEWKDDEDDAGDFLDRFKAEALQDRVYAMTPKGKIIDLTQGATPLDFAYQIHTEVGNRCRGAKVDGRIVPLNYELKTGEQVEVLTGKAAAPSRDWLSPHLGYLKTSRARAKVRQWFKQQDQGKNVSAGRTALEKEFHRLGVNLKTIDLSKVAERFNFTGPEELFAALGHGDITISSVVGKIQELILQKPRVDFLPVARRARSEESTGEIKIRGVGNLLTQMGRCCRPLPYDPIIGFITRGRGVTIHRQDCANVLDLSSSSPERLIEVDWGEETQSVYSVDILIDAYDRPGLLRDISSILANEKVNVLAVHTQSDRESVTARMALTVEIADVVQLSRVLDRISQLPNVTDARRRE
jgi:GTP pyrophosphokinase